MKIALFGNLDREENKQVSKEIVLFFQKHSIPVSVNESPTQETDFLISLGGDGTMLRLVHHFPQYEIPILGINTGHLGFMADIPFSELSHGLEDLLKGEYRIEHRVVIEGKACFAVNDIVIHRAHNPSLIDLAIHVDGKYLNTFSADGLIIATPNGSTAYSLAAGGPILTPELQALIITPICAHTISNRPIVLWPETKIEVEYLSPYESIEVTADGFSVGPLRKSEVFPVTKSRKSFRVVSLNRLDYYSTLRTKLAWAGQVRYSLLNHRKEWD